MAFGHVDEQVVVDATGKELVLRIIGQALLEPQRGQAAPASTHIGWHAEQVFRPPARAAG